MKTKDNSNQKNLSPTAILTTALFGLPLFSCVNELFFDSNLFAPFDEIHFLAISTSALLIILFILLNKKIGNEMSEADKNEAQKILRSMGYKTKPNNKKGYWIYELTITVLLGIPLFYFGIMLPIAKIYTNSYGIPFESELIVSKKHRMSKICLHSPYITSEQLNGIILDRPFCISSNDYKHIPDSNGIIKVSGMKSYLGHTISNYSLPEEPPEADSNLKNKEDLLLKEWKETP